jgi:hypothetical protein
MGDSREREGEYGEDSSEVTIAARIPIPVWGGGIDE